MNTIVRLGLILLMLVKLSSCLPAPRPPFGVWQSENLDIILYVKPEYQRTPGVGEGYPAIYFADGEATNVWVVFGVDPLFAIYDMSAFGDGVFISDKWIFRGTFRIVNDKLYLEYITQERRYSLEQMIFHRLEEYDPINPRSWWVR